MKNSFFCLLCKNQKIFTKTLDKRIIMQYNTLTTGNGRAVRRWLRTVASPKYFFIRRKNHEKISVHDACNPYDRRDALNCYFL